MVETPSEKPENAYIFISYSHKDADYAYKLAKALEDLHLTVWIDSRIDYGTQWPRVIQDYLDACQVFIVIMTPNSYHSDWVQNELNRAQRKKKKNFPLLLEGNEPWLSVESTQYVDVRSGSLPPAKFFERIAMALYNHKITRYEIQALLENVGAFDKPGSSIPQNSRAKGEARYSTKQAPSSSTSPVVTADILKIVNLARSCPEAEAIEREILENRPSETDRVLLPLYIVHEYLENAYGLTTVEISEIMTQLGPGVKITRQNALRALVKRDAAKYVIADKLRKPGTGTRYFLNERGVKYMKSILKESLSTLSYR